MPPKRCRNETCSGNCPDNETKHVLHIPVPSHQHVKGNGQVQRTDLVQNVVFLAWVRRGHEQQLHDTATLGVLPTETQWRVLEEVLPLDVPRECTAGFHFPLNGSGLLLQFADDLHDDLLALTLPCLIVHQLPISLVVRADTGKQLIPLCCGTPIASGPGQACNHAVKVCLGRPPC